MFLTQLESPPFWETSFGSYAKKRYRFCGKEKDEESGMYYYGARYYSPWLCRFISVDPLAAKYPFYTPYQYAGNQPINFIDLDGMEQAPPPTPSAGSSIPIPAVNNVNQKSSTTTTLQPGLAPSPNTLSLGTVKPKGNTPPPSKVTPPSTAFTPSQDSGANSSSNATTEKIQKSQQSAALASQKLQSTTQLSADFRPDDLRAKSADDAEMYISLQKIGDAVPLFGEFIKAGSYNAMGMPEQRNASLIKGTAEVALTVGLSYVAPEALTFATVEANGGANVVAKTSTQFTKSSLQFGQQMHKGYKAGLADGVTTFKEFTGIKGIRPDFVDFGTKTIYELKPFNTRSIQLGTKQLNNYKTLFEQRYGGTWKTVLDTY